MNLFEICNVDKNKLEDELTQIITTDESLDSTYKEILLKLILSSGKRIRPIFTIVGSLLGPKKITNIYQMAALFELVHTATLIHDDVIDKADTRRNVMTVHKQTDNLTAVMLGNYLTARCAEVVANNQLEEYYYQNLNFTDLCESEIKQQDLLFNFDVSFEEYLEKTKNKTAILIAASFIAGANIAGADEKTLKYLYKYSINLGISFQIIDDILDFTQDSNHLGKPAGADLMNGNITLPVILALRNRKLNSDIIKLNARSSKAEFENCIKSIQNSKYIEKSKKISQNYLLHARKALKKIDSPHIDILNNIIIDLEKRSF
jgi:heptaprenyl diphosphate synthase